MWLVNHPTSRHGQFIKNLLHNYLAGFFLGLGYVTPQDVKSIGMDVLRHRVAITYEAEAEEKTSETVIQKIFDELPVP